ncbi:MarR family winged helix-turn-helix transcriptional regulator [Salininema proteolyticum]|uniref:MarR family winged helix-turn-helix transcriptional regulator n=1 Tax=Salininema proteolyticum TaxID=1607685 RepID=A0ABV8U4T2_9ACTN
MTSSSSAFDGLTTTGEQWIRVIELHTRVNQFIERALHRRCRLGMNEFLALSACARSEDGEMRMQELTEAISLNQSSVSRLVNRLERTGMTERRKCDFDRRGVYTGITENGRNTLKSAVPVYEEALAEALGHVRLDPQMKDLVARFDLNVGI